jgi:3' terminal RNA ribose 2'-O-methyltransferase Hen1
VIVMLTVTTTRVPATDLGYLLMKHPDRVHQFEVPAGTAYVCFPEATEQRCTAALILDVDPARLLGEGRRGGRRTPDDFTLGRFVNDRPYAASSLLAAACKRVFATAMRGTSTERPELAAAPMPLEIHLPALRCRGGAALVTAVFEPLGWAVAASPVALDPEHPEWGPSRYLDLRLTGEVRLADALNQIYVLLPVFDDAKHYWVAPDEIDKLLRAGGGWLADHPERELITRRYLAHRRALAAVAGERLEALRTADGTAGPDSVDSVDTGIEEAQVEEDAELPAPVRPVALAEQRRHAVRRELERSGAARVLDLGCGSGALLADLVRDKRYTELVGVDVATQVLRLAERRLRLDRTPERQRGRVTLLQSALTYTDDRLVGYDAAVLMEVIEHVDPPRLAALAGAVFGHARPSTVVITTPNVEYNARYEGMAAGALRHHDHRFEWSRAEFAAWCAEVGRHHGYDVRIEGVGDGDPDVGHPTQLCVFTRKEARA